MAGTPGPWSNERVEAVVGLFLRGGVMIASLFVLLGGLLYLIHFGSSLPHYNVFVGEPSDLRSVSGILTEVRELSSRGLIQFGLLLLMFTPVAWVAFLFFAFFRQRDFTYVIVSLIVLSVLVFSLVGRYR